jgi:hypothetical protein
VRRKRTRDRNIVVETRQQEIARLNRRRKALDLTPGAQNRTANYLARSVAGDLATAPSSSGEAATSVASVLWHFAVSGHPR